MKLPIRHSLLGLSLTCFCAAADHRNATPESTARRPAPRAFAVLALANPRAVALDLAGHLYVGDVDSGTVHKITPAGAVTQLGGQAIKNPIGLAVDRAGAVFAADADDNSVFEISPTGAVAKVGPPAPGETGFNTPTSVAVDAAGNVFVADNAGAAIRKIAPGGAVSTFAGKHGATGSADGAGADARFATPRGLAIDVRGNLYVADEGNSNIRKITPAGVVTTLAGTAGQTGSTDGTGPAARFAAPRGLATDSAGNVYVADTDNHTIRKITSAGAVTTLAGKPGESGNANGAGAAARFSEPRGIAVDAWGDVFVADTGNAAIRQITPAGVVTTIVSAARP